MTIVTKPIEIPYHGRVYYHKNPCNEIFVNKCNQFMKLARKLYGKNLIHPKVSSILLYFDELMFGLDLKGNLRFNENLHSLVVSDISELPKRLYFKLDTDDKNLNSKLEECLLERKPIKLSFIRKNKRYILNEYLYLISFTYSDVKPALTIELEMTDYTFTKKRIKNEV